MTSQPRLLLKTCLFILALVAGFQLWAVTSVLADVPVTVILRGDETPETIKRTVDTLARDGKAVIVKIAPAGKPGESLTASPAADQDDVVSRLENFWNHFVEGVARGYAAVPKVALLPNNWSKAWAANINGNEGPSAGWRLILVLALAGFAAFVARAASRSWFANASKPKGDLLVARFKAALSAAAHDLLTLAIFWITARLAARLMLPQADLAARTANILIIASSYVALYAIGGRFVLGPDNPARRLMPLPRAGTHFNRLLVYALLGQLTLIIAAMGSMVATDQGSTAGLFSIVIVPVALYKLWWFWDMRHDLTALILGLHARNTPADTHGLKGGGLWLIAHAAPWFYVLSSVIIWMTGRAATMMPNGFQWGIAAGQTQVLLALIPLSAVGLTALIRSARMQRCLDQKPNPVMNAASLALESGMGALAWAAGIYLLVRIWSNLLIDMNSAEYGLILRQALVVATVTFAAWVLLTFLRSYFDAYATKRPVSGPADEDAAIDESVPSRLGTVLPVLRGLVLGAVIALAGLIIISRLGVDIAPLLAGFGILGLAISFGSQALVRDIVSGFFFMVEDAFRVGEYVDTGRLKGTVEKISLRSVQLRHQSGQIHTVPFGQIPSLTNASRDWATVKFNLRLDRSVDIEKARKAIKKVGAAMMEDQELAPHLIEPLKMQGVADIADSAIVVRLKFTAKPAHASVVQRQAMKLVYQALNDAGIPFASNAVTVRSPEERVAAAALSAQPQVPAATVK